LSEIGRLRTLHPNLGKEKLHVLLQRWCAEQGIVLPSVVALGRIIARSPDKPLKPRKPKKVPAQALEVLACDTIERIRGSGLALCLGLGLALQARPTHRLRPAMGAVAAASSAQDAVGGQRQRV
jgi:hypothetical protein